MVGADPRFQTHDYGRADSPGAVACAPRGALLAGSHRWRLGAPACVFVPLSLVLAQCGRAPSPGTLAANARASSGDTFSSGDSFDDRFPAPQFRDRFPAANESLAQRQISDFTPARTAQSEPAPYRVASLAPQIPYQRPTAKQNLTTLVSMKSSAFPYYGNNPASDAPFLNISKGDRRGHRSYGGRVYWQDETHKHKPVLGHVPGKFDVRKPAGICGFLPGNAATRGRAGRDPH